MSDSQVIARRFRPQTFTEVVGQEAITRTLANALTSGRLHHGYIFSGARGVGKTTTARILAKAMNCVNGPTTEPCGVCPSCVEIAQSRSIDVLEIDAATHTGVDNVRDVIISTVAIAPARDRYKIFIIDEVHMLSNQAFNALLKTLEEPPPHVVFILATTELHKVPETILSRCQVFEFRTISQKKIFAQLRDICDQMGVTISDRALLQIARAGEGSMRDAESALDQVISFAGTQVADEDVSAALGLVDTETLNDCLRAIAEQDARRLFGIVEELVSRGYDLRNFCRELMIHTRALLVTKVAGFDVELLQMPAEEGPTISGLADQFSEQDLVRFFAILTRTEQDIRLSTQPRFQLEIGLMKLAHARRLYLLEEALQKLEDLSARLGGAPAPGGFAPPGQTPPRPAGGPPRTPPRGLSTSPAPAAPERSRPAPPARTAPPPAPRTPEPPSFDEAPVDEPEEIVEAMPARASAAAGDGQAIAANLRAALEARNKPFLLAALAPAQIAVDGSVLRITFAPADAVFKARVESKDNRRLIEEVCRELTGRPVSLSISIGAQAAAEPPPEKREATALKETAQQHPAVRALVDKFHGDIVEVVKPEE